MGQNFIKNIVGRRELEVPPTGKHCCEAILSLGFEGLRNRKEMK